MNQTAGTYPAADPPAAPDSDQPGEGGAATAETSAPPTGFGARGRLRRRARFLRKARELAYRDLGGLVFNLHRFGQRNDALVLAKLEMIGHIDGELRKLESVLGERASVTVLREAGITACPRCAAIHSGEDRFCPNCGLSMSRHVDLPISSAPLGAGGPPPAASSQPAASQAASSAPAPSPAAPSAPVAPSPAARAPAAPSAATASPTASAPAAPVQAPAPTEDTQVTPALPAGAPAGRSPTPPATARGAASGSGKAPPVADMPEETPATDEPTEILHRHESDK